MHRFFYPLLFIVSINCYSIRGNAQANQTLSNLLTPTAVNTHLLPYKTDSYNLGGRKINWHFVYLGKGVFIRDTMAMHAPGIGNFFAGMDAGTSISTGESNTGFGNNVLASLTDGYENTAAGYNTLTTTTGGHENTAFGFKVLEDNTTGFSNTAFGHYAMRHSTIASDNVAIGDYTMPYIITGSNNTAVGVEAMSSTDLLASWNTALGSYALDHISTGESNVGVGDFALHGNYTGDYNTAIGALSDVSSNNFDHATAIGAQAVVNASNKMQLGSSTTVLATAGGITIVSDGRFKDNVDEEEVPGLTFVNQLRPVAYTMNYQRYDNFLRKNEAKDRKTSLKEQDIIYQQTLADKSNNREVGFIAQEVNKLCTDNKYVFNGVYVPQNDNDNYALDYSRFVVPLVKAVQQLSQKNEENKVKIDGLQQQIDELKAMIRPTAGVSVTLSDASLDQNVPNPFHGNTTIPYTLPQRYGAAQVIIRDNAGKLLKEIAVSGNGRGTISVDASVLSAGTYNYSLVIDGRTVSTKQMLLGR